MSDKKYKELSKRLDSRKKSASTFSSYHKQRLEAENRPDRDYAPEEKPAKPVKKRSGSNKQSRDFLSKLMLSSLPILLIIFVIIFGVYALVKKDATEVAVNGDLIGQLKTTKFTKDEFILTLEAKLKELEHTNVQLLDEITLTPVHGKSKYIMDDSLLLNKLVDVVNYKVEASEISVDGSIIGIAANKEESQSIFNALMNKYITTPDNTTARFVEDVAARDIFVDKGDIDSSEYIRGELEKTATTNKEYEVVSGDTLSKIAALNGMTVSGIKDCNPDLDIDKPLKIGQKIMIVSNVPYVSVLTTETKTEIVDVPMTVVEQQDATLPAGQTRILQQGRAGKKEVVSQITRINGIISGDNQVSEVILEPAEVQIVAKGTQ